jgi:hypothetical protein
MCDALFVGVWVGVFPEGILIYIYIAKQSLAYLEGAWFDAWVRVAMPCLRSIPEMFVLEVGYWDGSCIYTYIC